MLRKVTWLRTFNNFFSLDIRQPENEHANVEEIRQLRAELNDTKGDLARVIEERDYLNERCEILAKKLEEAKVAGDSRKERTTTSQYRVTSPRELKCKGKRRLRISIILNSMGNQRQKQCFEVKGPCKRSQHCWPTMLRTFTRALS